MGAHLVDAGGKSRKDAFKYRLASSVLLVCYRHAVAGFWYQCNDFLRGSESACHDLALHSIVHVLRMFACGCFCCCYCNGGLPPSPSLLQREAFSPPPLAQDAVVSGRFTHVWTWVLRKPGVWSWLCFSRCVGGRVEPTFSNFLWISPLVKTFPSVPTKLGRCGERLQDGCHMLPCR